MNGPSSKFDGNITNEYEGNMYEPLHFFPPRIESLTDEDGGHHNKKRAFDDNEMKHPTSTTEEMEIWAELAAELDKEEAANDAHAGTGIISPDNTHSLTNTTNISTESRVSAVAKRTLNNEIDNMLAKLTKTMRRTEQSRALVRYHQSLLMPTYCRRISAPVYSSQDFPDVVTLSTKRRRRNDLSCDEILPSSTVGTPDTSTPAITSQINNHDKAPACVSPLPDFMQ